MKYIVLLRGVNVGGQSKVSMADLRRHLEGAGYQQVRTYINSGNLLLESDLSAKALGANIEDILRQHFALGSQPIKVLVLTSQQLQAVVNNKPQGFGGQPGVYHSDVLFMMGGQAVSEALKVFSPREGVDTIWPGDGVIYSQRLSQLRTKSRLNRIMGTPEYRSMTIRTWNTVVKLAELSGAG